MTKPTPPTIDAHSALSVQRGDRTQVGDAARFIEAAHGRLLFDAQGSRWLHFERHRWRADNGTARALSIALETLREFADTIPPGEIGRDQASYRQSRLLLNYPKSLLAFVAQSVSSLGEHAERLMANCGTDILHRSPLPQALLELAGTTPVWEDLHETGPAGMRIPTGGRRQQTYRIDPDLIRTLPAGQVVLVRNGRWAQVAVALPAALTGPSPAPH